MHFSWDLSLGTFVTILTVLIGIHQSRVANSKELAEMKAKMDLMYQWFLIHVTGKDALK